MIGTLLYRTITICISNRITNSLGSDIFMAIFFNEWPQHIKVWSVNDVLSRSISLDLRRPIPFYWGYGSETIKDFLIKLGIKPLMYIWKKKHFFTKQWHHQTHQNYEQQCQRSQNFEFKSNFSLSKIGWTFSNSFLWKKKFY